jgi:hypothetical protein
MTTIELRELSAEEIDTIAGAALANPTFRITVYGYGFEFNSRTVCILTPDGGACKNIPQS